MSLSSAEQTNTSAQIASSGAQIAKQENTRKMKILIPVVEIAKQVSTQAQVCPFVQIAFQENTIQVRPGESNGRP